MDYNFLKESNLIIYEAIIGSHAYGTNIETSDVDRKYVYILPIDYILSGKYVDQVNDEKNDVVGYELGKFLNLLAVNNPNMLEMLASPKECILHKDPLFDLILDKKDLFVTKICAKSFGGYASQQIKKAKGQDKKQNWEKDRVERKLPLDFCFIHINEKSIPLPKYMEMNAIKQEFCGLSKVPHSKELYSLFYDKQESLPYKYRGISFESSNDLRLSSISIDDSKSDFLGYISYNKDGYTCHCDDYRSYQKWLENRNIQRWVDVQSHGQKIDGKNMMHCKRLIEMALEIGQGKGIIVKRPNASELLDIRKGKINLDDLIKDAEYSISIMDSIYENSNLPNNVDMEIVQNLILEIRKKFYKLN